MRFVIPVLFLILSAVSAQAQMTLEGILNATNPETGYETVEFSADKKAATVYSGLTVNTCTSADGVKTCDSCTAALALPAVCNKKQMPPTGWLVVQIKSTNTALFTSPATPALKVKIGSTVYDVEASQSSTSLSANNVLNAAVRWSNICLGLGTDANCTKSFSGSITVGVSKAANDTIDESVTINVKHRYVNSSPAMTWNATDCSAAGTYELLCHYQVYPGDGKAYLFDYARVASNSSFSVPDLTTGLGTASDSSGQKYKYIRLFFLEGNIFTTITPASGSYDLPIDSTTGTVTDKRMLDLENDQEYAFLGAAVDQGGNVTYFANPTDLSVTTGADLQAGTPNQTATPGPVYGLLDGSKCFIATAAYGSEMAPEVEMLRQFRNQYLLTHAWGRALVRVYYFISPPLADFIAQHEPLRRAVRWALQPVVDLVKWGMDKN